jgi:hypothetical protein
VIIVLSTPGEEQRFRVNENRVLRKMFGPKREALEGRRYYVMNSFIILNIMLG